MKSFSNSILYIFVGILSFVFFLYLSFPYNLLKESLTLRVNQNASYRVKMADLSPNLPLGVQVKDLSLDMYGRSIELKHLELELGVFSLLTGRVKLSFLAQDRDNGSLEGIVTYGISSLISGRPEEMIPEYIYIEGKRFVFGQAIDFILNAQANSSDVNLLLKPWLESIDINGKLNLNIDMDISPKDLQKSKGKINLNIEKMSLKSLNDSLSIPDQIFKRFRFKANLTNGTLTVDKSSGLESQDLTLDIQGKVVQKPQVLKSQLDILANLKLGEPLQKEFGFIIDTFLQIESKGELNIQIKGPLTPQPNIEFL